MKKLLCSALQAAPNITVYHTGPSLDHGPLPAIFYFTLAGPDSLTVDPYNQPVQFLSDRWIRFFSLTLPAHENGLSPHNALNVWAEDIAKGIDILGQFLDAAELAIDFTIRQKLVDPQKLGLAGLSRGAFIASHLAAREKRFHNILQFAPLTRLEKTKEFQTMQSHPIVRSLDLFALAPSIADRNIRFYIGNRDTRVDTRSCFEFAMQLVDKATVKSPFIELIISPSIGQHGHGTSPEIFRQGANWLADCLLSHL
jgi:esterase FrsA